MRIAQVKIQEYSQELAGRGGWQLPEGRTQRIDVPFCMPGDEVSVRLLKKKGGVYQGYPLEWTCLAEGREAPKCKHFGHCGGCRLQHMPYEVQLKEKEARVYSRLSPFFNPETELRPIIPCNPPWRYRNKMELTFSEDKGGSRYLGLILYGTRGHVFQMEECHLIGDWAIEAVAAVSKWWKESGLFAYHCGSDKGSLRTLTLREGRSSGDRMAMLTVSGNPDFALNRKQIKDFTAALQEAIEPPSKDGKLSIFLRIQQTAKGSPTQFYEMHLFGPDHIRETLCIETARDVREEYHFRISPSAFFQPNPRQAEKLYSSVLQLTQIPKDGLVLDLYCGTGTLGICMAKNARKVIGVDLSPESTLDARENVKINGLTNVSIFTGDVGHLLPTLLQEGQPIPDAVLIDPPRSGLDPRAIKHLLAIQAPLLTYISCNPATQAANLEPLIQAGYRLKAVQSVDQFPHTAHVENIAVLHRC